MIEGVRLQRFVGPEIEPWIPEFARLRITIFREYPYLYDGDLEYEKNYLSTYTNSSESMMTVVTHDGRVVGATSALPLKDEMEEIKQPFLNQGYEINQIYYFGESVLLPEYRGQGIGVKFFEEREDQARKFGYPITCFCAVERPPGHPRRPAGYKPLDEFWTHRGYTKQPKLRTTISWQELDEDHESPKPMVFWMKTK